MPGLPSFSLPDLRRSEMGVVYLVRDSRLDREVAIKALPEHLAVDPDRLTRFERETKTPSEYGGDEQQGRRTMSTALEQCNPVL